MRTLMFASVLTLGFAAPTLAQTPDTAIYTTFYPTKFMAQFIADGTIGVECPVPADADPIFWKPTREEIARFQQASLIIVNGAEYEKWVATASLPESRVVNTAKRFKDQWIKFESVTHSHGGQGAHTHEGIDGHTWMDPINAKAQAEQIKIAMGKRWPQHAKKYDDRFQALAAEFDKLDTRFKSLTPKVQSARLFASHPAYNYIAKRYGWNITNVALDPEADLKDDDVKAVRSAMPTTAQVAKRIMLWEAQPQPATVKRLSDEFQLNSVVFEPCETLASIEEKAGVDYLKLMAQNLDRLEAALK